MPDHFTYNVDDEIFKDYVVFSNTISSEKDASCGDQATIRLGCGYLSSAGVGHYVLVMLARKKTDKSHVALITEVNKFDELTMKILKIDQINTSMHLTITITDDAELRIYKLADLICIPPDPYKNGGPKCFHLKPVFPWIFRLKSLNKTKIIDVKINAFSLGFVKLTSYSSWNYFPIKFMEYKRNNYYI